jgi:hypothetical protein
VSEKGFIPLKSVAGKGPSTPAQILDEIRTIYFTTTKHTIQNDVAHAIELLKRLPDEETREKATVYMHGLAEMRKEFGNQTGNKEKGRRKKAKSSRQR